MENTTKTSTALSIAASVASSAILIQTLATGFVPYRFQQYLSSSLSSLLSRLSSQLAISIDEHDGPTPNRMYQSVESYLSTKLPPSARHVRVTLPEDDSDVPQLAIHPGEEVADHFQLVTFTWKLVCREKEPRRTHRRHPNYPNRSYESVVPESKTFVLTFHRKHREVAIGSYLPYIVERAKRIREETKMLKLHTNGGDDYWTAVSLRHPSRFETMAMEEGAKRELVEDLDRFVRRKEYYRRAGRAWKRGYLLYGPPGTGKSSLVAAMANYLRFDVYDLELSNVGSNSELRSLLVGTANRSILVVEDMDCSIEFRPRSKEKEGLTEIGEEEKVTLSGLLNFVDGLWSSCGDERIIVFTTNNKDRLDPALLRPGRMDVHIHMSYCTPCGFRVLASNYHAIDDHPLFREIEELLQEVEVTPAEVAEELMRSDDPNVALGGLIRLLRKKKSNR